MADLGIIWYPKRILREPTKRVRLEEIQTKEFLENISQMFSIMYYRDGVGLAAPQVGWNVSLFITNPHGRSYHDSYGKIFINPSVVGIGDTAVGKEGCLSFPGIFANVKRNTQASIRYTNTAANEIEEKYDGFMARIIQHEFDHLNGILFIDRLTKIVKRRIQPKLDSHRQRVRRIRKKRKKNFKEAEARKKKKAEKRRKQRKKRKDKQ